MKILNPRFHGFADYAVVGLFLASPTLLGMNGMQANLCYGLAGVHLLVTLLTNMPLGAFKVLPMRIHGFIELAVAPSLAAMPWVFGFSGDRNALMFFSIVGAVIFVAWLMTDYNAVTVAPNTNAAAHNPQEQEMRKAA